MSSSRNTPRLPEAIGYISVALLFTVVSGAPPPSNFARIGPGAPVGPLFTPDAETTALQEYLGHCKEPGNHLCDAYQDINTFYSRLVVSGQETLLRDAFATHRQTSIEELCSALEKTGPVLKTISAKDTRYFKTLTKSSLCERRCAELDQDDTEIVLPICKLLAYELQEIARRSVPGNSSVSAPSSSSTLGSIAANAPSSLAAVAAAVKDEPPVQLPAVPVPPSIPQLNAALEKKPVAPAIVVAVTPGTKPQLAEDVQPALVAVSTNTTSTTTTSTENYSNVNVLGQNNNEPDENLNLPGLDNSNKQSQQPLSPVDEANKMLEKSPNLGSLDNETGGYPNADADEFGPNEEEVDEYEQSDAEKAAAAAAAAINTKPKIEEEKNAIKVGESEKLIPPPPPLQSHNKKPTQVGDSFEMEGKLDQVNRAGRNKISEVIDDPFYEETDSNFFAYFMLFMAICVLGYVGYHNKSKVLALLLEGRRGSGSGGRGGGAGLSRRRSSRKHTAQYQKLDTNLEEAISSTGQSRTSQVIY